MQLHFRSRAAMTCLVESSASTSNTLTTILGMNLSHFIFPLASSSLLALTTIVSPIASRCLSICWGFCWQRKMRQITFLLVHKSVRQLISFGSKSIYIFNLHMVNCKLSIVEFPNPNFHCYRAPHKVNPISPRQATELVSGVHQEYNRNRDLECDTPGLSTEAQHVRLH